jgi:hypothetical protein
MSKLAIASILFVSLVGCMTPPDSGTATESLTGADAYDLSWVLHDDGGAHGYIIRADLVIDAPVDVVWKLVRDPNGYASFNKALTAHVDKMEVGQPISLDIRLFGDSLPPTNSAEVIAIFDEDLHVASWDRDFGLGSVTHRPQLLVAEGNKTHYYTALALPWSFGWIVGPLTGPAIHDAFGRFAIGLRAAAEAAK